jgi:hypothetical protein
MPLFEVFSPGKSATHRGFEVFYRVKKVDAAELCAKNDS